MILQDRFLEITSHTIPGSVYAHAFWREIEKHYSEAGRFYHNLTHLQEIFRLLDEMLPSSQSDALSYAVFYHDIVYDVQKNDNEERSAGFAARDMERLLVPAATIAQCRSLILATKAHEAAGPAEMNYFTDADLSILGREPEEYQAYCMQIRKEYAVYPDGLYNPGRARVLRHFLDMPRIYKTDLCFSRYEAQARRNMSAELASLEGAG